MIANATDGENEYKLTEGKLKGSETCTNKADRRIGG